MREQFRHHTESVLLELHMGRRSIDSHLFKSLQETDQYRAFIAARETLYMARQEDEIGAVTAHDLYSTLVEKTDGSSEISKLLYSLQVA